VALAAVCWAETAASLALCLAFASPEAARLAASAAALALSTTRAMNCS